MSVRCAGDVHLRDYAELSSNFICRMKCCAALVDCLCGFWLDCTM
jgi:hypothetical protein